MSTAITFDTLKYANRLKEAGLEPRIAEAEVNMLAEVMEVNLKELATKADLKHLESTIRIEMVNLRAEMSVQRWMLGVVVAGIIALVLKAFF